jgi:hypothetical protein
MAAPAMAAPAMAAPEEILKSLELRQTMIDFSCGLLSLIFQYNLYYNTSY